VKDYDAGGRKAHDQGGVTMLNLMKLESRIVLDGAAIAEAIGHDVDHDTHAEAQVTTFLKRAMKCMHTSQKPPLSWPSLQLRLNRWI